MEQFRHIGEVVGSLKALMVFQNNIFNQKQCLLLVDMFTSGFETIAHQMRHNLRFEEKNTKWKIIENPLKELLRVYKEGEAYIKLCLETKDFWSKTISLHQNSDCVEFHIHNLLTSIPIVIEAIELAGQISGCDQDEIQKKKFVYSLKYQKDWKDPKLFSWKFGEQYLVSQDFCSRLNSIWDEDRWFLLKRIKDKKNVTCKRDHRLADILIKYLGASEDDKPLLPSSTLLQSKDYQVRRRLGTGGQYKEIQWLGENFALRHFLVEIELLFPEISKELSLSHPNIMHILCGFTDEEKKECYLIMELMNRNLSSYIKENCGSGAKKRVPFSLLAAVDLMLQIARGMEYLHSKNIYHGELKPSNILIKPRHVNTTDGYLHAKVSGFGLTQRNPENQQQQPLSFIWYAPEVLSEQENGEKGENVKYNEKCDVYSFGMICFEVLTGKVPFEDLHLQGDKMSRNIRLGERPLFPFHSPKYITNLTKKCWHNDPSQRPSFSSICKFLRYIKRFLVMNPEHGQPDAPMPPLDFNDIETGIVVRSCLITNGTRRLLSVSDIPFEMFAYRVIEREKGSMGNRDVLYSTTDQSGTESEGTSTCGDQESLRIADDPYMSPTDQKKSFAPSPEVMIRKLSLSKKSLETQSSKPGTPRGRSVRPPHTPRGRSIMSSPHTPRGRSIMSSPHTPKGRSIMRTSSMSSESNLMMMMSPRTRRTSSGHASDSELS